MSVLLSFKRLRQEDEKFNAVLSYTVSLAQLGLYDISCQKKMGLVTGMTAQSVCRHQDLRSHMKKKAGMVAAACNSVLWGQRQGNPYSTLTRQHEPLGDYQVKVMYQRIGE